MSKAVIRAGRGVKIKWVRVRKREDIGKGEV